MPIFTVEALDQRLQVFTVEALDQRVTMFPVGRERETERGIMPIFPVGHLVPIFPVGGYLLPSSYC